MENTNGSTNPAPAPKTFDASFKELQDAIKAVREVSKTLGIKGGSHDRYMAAHNDYVAKLAAHKALVADIEV